MQERFECAAKTGPSAHLAASAAESDSTASRSPSDRMPPRRRRSVWCASSPLVSRIRSTRPMTHGRSSCANLLWTPLLTPRSSPSTGGCQSLPSSSFPLQLHGVRNHPAQLFLRCVASSQDTLRALNSGADNQGFIYPSPRAAPSLSIRPTARSNSTPSEWSRLAHRTRPAHRMEEPIGAIRTRRPLTAAATPPLHLCRAAPSQLPRDPLASASTAVRSEWSVPQLSAPVAPDLFPGTDRPLHSLWTSDSEHAQPATKNETQVLTRRESVRHRARTVRILSTYGGHEKSRDTQVRNGEQWRCSAHTFLIRLTLCAVPPLCSAQSTRRRNS